MYASNNSCKHKYRNHIKKIKYFLIGWGVARQRSIYVTFSPWITL